MSCEKCSYMENGMRLYFECCCEKDRLQIIADDERAVKDGFIEINGRWIKKTEKLKKTKNKGFY
jgi:hypothetical protein